MKAVVKAFNESQALNNNKLFLKCVFNEPDGFYYDPVGNEIFHATCVGHHQGRPIYKLDFGYEKRTGIVIYHGMHLRLE